MLLIYYAVMHMITVVKIEQLRNVALTSMAATLFAVFAGCGLISATDTVYSEEYGEDMPILPPPQEVVAASQSAAEAPKKVDEKTKTSEAVSENIPENAVGKEVESFTPRKFNEPVMQTGYILRISVIVGDTTELDPTEVQIDDKEEISLPLIGKVNCHGMTLNELRSRLTSRYAEFMRDPEVTASFVYDEKSPSPFGQVQVQGRVNMPGWVNIPPTRSLRVSQAIQMAGGFAPSARKSSVWVTRRNEAGEKQRITVNITDIGRNGDLEKDIFLEPNDVIYVHESHF